MTENTLVCPPFTPADLDRSRRLRRAHRADRRTRRLRGALRFRRRHRLFAARAARHRPRQHERSGADGRADPRPRRLRISSSTPTPATAMRSTCNAPCACWSAPAPTRSRSRTRTFPSAAAISTTRRSSRRRRWPARSRRRSMRARRRDTLIIARTDAVAGEGFDRAVARAALYREAGADMLFVEAPRRRDRARPHRRAARQVRPADGQHGGRRQDADAAGARAGGARLRAGDLSRAPSCARSPRRPRIFTPRSRPTAAPIRSARACSTSMRSTA